MLFTQPMEAGYEGRVVGEHCRDNDPPVRLRKVLLKDSDRKRASRRGD